MYIKQFFYFMKNIFNEFDIKAAVINAAKLCLVKKTINNPPKFEVVTSIK